MRRFITALGLSALSLAFGLHSGRPAAAAAYDLRANQYCAWTTPGMLSAQVSWSADFAGAQQWLDISEKDNGWQPGTFASFPVAPNASSQMLTDLMPNTDYYVEVSQVYADGTWQFSPTRVLHTSSCFFVPDRVAPYGAYFGQNPSDGARLVTALSETNGTPSVTTTTATAPNNSTSGSGSGSSSSSGSGNAPNNCGVPTKSGSPIQAPLNAGANGVTSLSGC